MNQMELFSISGFRLRRDQRAFMLTSPADGRPCPPRPRRFRSAKSALVTSRFRLLPNVRRASACGTATVVSLRLRSCVSPPVLHFPVRRTAGRSLTCLNRIRFSHNLEMPCLPMAWPPAQNLRFAKSTGSRAHRNAICGNIGQRKMKERIFGPP
jgi:hypothetical protein